MCFASQLRRSRDCDEGACAFRRKCGVRRSPPARAPSRRICSPSRKASPLRICDVRSGAIGNPGQLVSGIVASGRHRAAGSDVCAAKWQKERHRTRPWLPNPGIAVAALLSVPPTQYQTMLSTTTRAAVVAATGIAAWAGSIAGHWWDLLTAWLIWGSVVLWALICELRRSNSSLHRHRQEDDRTLDLPGQSRY